MRAYIESWSAWSAEEDPDARPDLEFLPGRAKRRMSQLSRMILQVGHELLEKKRVNDVVFASRYGELGRQLEITEGILDEGEVSPSSFSYSVFNTPVALLSLHEGITGATRAIYAGEQAFSAGLMQSMLRISNGKSDSLLYLYGDERVPPVYRSLLAGEDVPLALGMILRREDCPGSIRIDMNNAAEVNYESDNNAEESPLGFHHMLSDSRESWILESGGLQFCFKRKED